MKSNRDRITLSRAQRLRREMTGVERFAWSKLRGKQANGLRFRRQQPIGPYIVDFVCAERMVVVELDGAQHAEARDHDETRDRFLASAGYRVLRFWNHEVLTQWDAVAESILKALEEATPHPSPPPQGGRESSTG